MGDVDRERRSSRAAPAPPSLADDRAMRSVRHDFERALLDAWMELLREAGDQAGVEARDQVFVYLSGVDGGDDLLQAIVARMDDEEREQVMGLRKQWEDAAREEGIERGIRRGRVESLLSQLQLKFGDIGEARREQIAGASLRELERWSQRILDATSLEDALS